MVHSTTVFESSDRGAAGPPVGFTLTNRLQIPYNSTKDDSSFAFGMGAAEQMTYETSSARAYVVSETGILNVVDYSSSDSPVLRQDLAVDLSGAVLTDVEVCGDLLFLATGAVPMSDPGALMIFNITDRESAPKLQSTVTVGALPDMILPNADCSVVAVGNEGEGVYSESLGLVDPVGSVHLVFSPFTDDATTDNSVEISLAGLGTDDAALMALGLHLPLSESAMEYWDLHSDIADDVDFSSARSNYKPEMNLEPEYLAWSASGTTLYVNLQENNGLVQIRLDAESRRGVAGMRVDSYGYKFWSDEEGGGIDLVQDGLYEPRPYDSSFRSARMPDSIAAVAFDGREYILTANEGDKKEYGEWEEKIKSKNLFTEDGRGTLLKGGSLGPDLLMENTSAWADGTALEDTVLSLGSSGVDYSEPAAPVVTGLVSFGSRGWSIFAVDEQSGIDLVFDSGSEMERETAARFPWAHNGIQDEEYALVGGVLYNASSSEFQKDLEEMNDPAEDGCDDRGDGQPGACPLGGTVDRRSPKDGPAPEAIVAGVACDRLVIVTASEKQGTLFVYDASEDIAQPELIFVEHLSPASETLSPEIAFAKGTLGEIDPEAMYFLSGEDSPSGRPGLLVAGAWSGTLSFWEFECPAAAA